jgi:anthranilate/para-aminobenzoate synthase component I
VTDPWERFVEASGTAELAGYVELAGEDGRAGRARWYSSGAESCTIGALTDPEELGSRSDRFLRQHRHGAVVGYLGFDAVGLFEPALRRYPRGSPFPLGELAFVPQARSASCPVRRARRLPPTELSSPEADSLPRRRFERSVGRLVEAIRAGEAFQVVLAHRRAWPRPMDLLERAGRLRAAERFSCFYYLRFGDRELVGATPESVAEVAGRRAFVDPIAGTLPYDGSRGRRPLALDPKELCEHRMLVDLARNDLGRVAVPGSVHLAWSERLVRYARVEHLVSRVAATLPPGAGPWDVLASAFPAGTVSGAPKIRATELLRAEEASWRGPYAGTVACLEPGGRATFSLAIRSAFAAGRRLYTAAGAGVVHRSRPTREFHETLAKLSVVESALVGEAS